MAKKKYIQSPDILWKLFVEYTETIKKKPIKKMDFKGKDATRVEYELERPLTFDGFENYVADQNVIQDLGHYFANTDNAYEEFRTICSRIKRVIRQDQIEGGMAGIYNPSITQRLNNLRESSDVDVKVTEVAPIFNIDE